MTTATIVLHYVPVPPEVAAEARRTMTDAFGHPLEIAEVAAPCRICLRIAKTPERMMLLSYRPLEDRGPYSEVGPIFVHAEPCEPYAELGSFPADFAERPLILRAYDREGRIAAAVSAQPGQAPREAERMLGDEAIAEVHVRHVTYTCFDFKIVRGG